MEKATVHGGSKLEVRRLADGGYTWVISIAVDSPTADAFERALELASKVDRETAHRFETS